MNDGSGRRIRVPAGVVAAAVICSIFFTSGCGRNTVAEESEPSTPPAQEQQTTDDDLTSSSGSESTASNRETTTPPTAFDETTEGRLVLRLFQALSKGKITADGFQPDPSYDEIVEIRRENVPPIPGGMLSFYQWVMTKGPWEVAGRVIAGSAREPAREDQGRVLQPREAFLLIRQGDEWLQIKFSCDFVYLQDGRVLISYETMSVPEVHHLDPELVPKYREMYGVTG